MKQSVITLILALGAVTGWAQNYVVKPQEATAEDYIKLLNYAKYEAFSYDISSLIDSTRLLEFCYREYEEGKMIAEKSWIATYNRDMISSYSEKDQKEIREEGSAYDEANDVYKVRKSITIGFMPIKNDSIVRIFLDVDDGLTGGIPLKIKPVINPTNGEKRIDYIPTPYKVTSFEFNKFIPLAFYGSWWYDKVDNIFRRCGEMELEDGKPSILEKYTTHYYIIGVKVKR